VVTSTALIAAVGFLPAALATGKGAEILQIWHSTGTRRVDVETVIGQAGQRRDETKWPSKAPGAPNS
jgi:hypothetical protein